MLSRKVRYFLHIPLDVLLFYKRVGWKCLKTMYLKKELLTSSFRQKKTFIAGRISISLEMSAMGDSIIIKSGQNSQFCPRHSSQMVLLHKRNLLEIVFVSSH